MECPALWDYYQPDRVAGIDAIVSCGDLKKEYLEFLVTMTGKPLLYVPGNHDTRYVSNPPEGCESIDGRVVTLGGLRFAGLGGCKKYTDTPFQYTEKEMAKKVKKLHRQIRKAGGLDVFISHASMTGCGDAEDIAHRGFDCFRDLADRWRPQVMCHGHVHQSYGWSIPRQLEYNGIPVINVYERFVLDIPAPGAPRK